MKVKIVTKEWRERTIEVVEAELAKAQRRIKQLEKCLKQSDAKLEIIDKAYNGGKRI